MILWHNLRRNKEAKQEQPATLAMALRAQGRWQAGFECGNPNWTLPPSEVSLPTGSAAWTRISQHFYGYQRTSISSKAFFIASYFEFTRGIKETFK